MGKIKDLTGKRFGRLVVIERVNKGKTQYYWKCQCDCGNIAIVRGQSLREGTSKSCGCLRKEASSTRAKKGVHRLSHTKTYRLWWSILMKCFNENYPGYNNYGGRGITISDEWRDNFQTFHDYVSELEHYGEEGLSLDRINNEGNYEPGNVRWATVKEQSRNRRSNILIEYQGETICLKDAAERSGVKYGTLFSRYYRGLRGEKLFQKVH